MKALEKLEQFVEDINAFCTKHDITYGALGKTLILLDGSWIGNQRFRDSSRFKKMTKEELEEI